MLDQTQPYVSETAAEGVRNYTTTAVSPAIQRLMQEVRNKDAVHASNGKYDRTYNRHNRG